LVLETVVFYTFYSIFYSALLLSYVTHSSLFLPSFYQVSIKMSRLTPEEQTGLPEGPAHRIYPLPESVNDEARLHSFHGGITTRYCGYEDCPFYCTGEDVQSMWNDQYCLHLVTEPFHLWQYPDESFDTELCQAMPWSRSPCVSSPAGPSTGQTRSRDDVDDQGDEPRSEEPDEPDEEHCVRPLTGCLYFLILREGFGGCETLGILGFANSQQSNRILWKNARLAQGG
jgi:hypothetical protein